MVTRSERALTDEECRQLAARLQNARAEGAQCIDHVRGIVGVEQADQRRRALRERRQQQRAVGDAFRTGQRDDTFDVRDRSEVE